MLKFLKNQAIKNLNYANPHKRFLAYTIDVFILAIIRYIIGYILLYLWYAKSFYLFVNKYQEVYQDKTSHNMEQFYSFFITQNIFYETMFLLLIMLLIGTIYWVLLPLSKLGATFGKAIFKIKIVKLNDNPLNVKELLVRYLIALIPWIFHISTIIAVSTANKLLLVVCISIVVIWYEPKVIRRSYRATHDLICSTKVANKNS